MPINCESAEQRRQRRNAQARVRRARKAGAAFAQAGNKVFGTEAWRRYPDSEPCRTAFWLAGVEARDNA